MSPNQRHNVESVEILNRRHEVYETTKQLHPERWTGLSRNWSHVNEVWINVLRNQKYRRYEKN